MKSEMPLSVPSKGVAMMLAMLMRPKPTSASTSRMVSQSIFLSILRSIMLS